MKIEFTLNGVAVSADVSGDRRAVDLLREDFGLTGTKEGCGTGECGACTIMVDGRSRLSCLMLAAQLANSEVTTIEGLAGGETLHPVQTSFIASGAVQCGFCTPGMVLTAAELLEEKPHPTRHEIAEALSGNICRCTGYHKIFAAVETAGRHDPMPIQLPSAEEQGYRIPVVSRPVHQQEVPVFFPEMLDELWQRLADYPETGIFAGGTDYLVWLRSGRVSTSTLICLERMPVLRGVTDEGNQIRIGAATTHESLLADPIIREHYQVLQQALRVLGSPHIRRTGTIGGNIVTASPAGDTLPPLYVLGAAVELQSRHGLRRMPIADFIHGPGRTALQSGEILTAILVPKGRGSSLQHFEKVGLRQAMACAVASLAATLEISASGRIGQARLAWGSVGPTIVRLPEVEAALVGHPFDRATFTAAASLVGASLSPINDVRATASYRRQVSGSLLLRMAAAGTSGFNGGDRSMESSL
jgi:carbon-monoxide dehydrogenase small subunit/xanthine dehydrogenase small subunit